MHTEKWERNSANADLKYLPCKIFQLPAMISEGSRDRGKPRWCSIKLSILVCVNAVVIIGEYVTKWSKQRKIIVKGGGVDTLLLQQLPLCIMTRRL